MVSPVISVLNFVISEVDPCSPFLTFNITDLLICVYDDTTHVTVTWPLTPTAPFGPRGAAF